MESALVGGVGELTNFHLLKLFEGRFPFALNYSIQSPSFRGAMSQRYGHLMYRVAFPNEKEAGTVVDVVAGRVAPKSLKAAASMVWELF